MTASARGSSPHFGQRLVDVAHLAPGAHVLDVATGRGAVLFPATTQVGPHGRVIGIDLSGAMVQETAAELQRAAWPQAEIRQMDAAQLDFPDASFDAVLCGFALWCFPQPARALQEWFRVLKLGGRIGLTTWAEDCPCVTWQREALRPYVPPPGPQVNADWEALRFDTPATVERMNHRRSYPLHPHRCLPVTRPALRVSGAHPSTALGLPGGCWLTLGSQLPTVPAGNITNHRIAFS
jgi:SAM-dependent methyltransferase